MYRNLELNKRGNIVIVTLSRQQNLNALNKELLEELNEVIDAVSLNSSDKGLIITGRGKSFVAGADINSQKNFTPTEAKEWAHYGARLFRKIELMEIPTIAAVNGYALGGGCELAMACDMIFASETASFGQPEVSLGVNPGFSGTVRLPRKVGKSKALELLFSGEIISAAEAKEIGLINRIYSPELLIDETVVFMEKILTMGPTAVKNCKSAVSYGLEMSTEAAITYEAQLFSACYIDGEGSEGMTAFVEKRKPDFKDYK